MGAYSVVSADRRLRSMLEFRFLGGNAKALAYSYLVGIDFDPSAEIRMDFSGYQVRVIGRNLAPLFSALVGQRVAWVRELDDLHASATVPDGAAVVTKIVIESAAQPAPVASP